MSKKKVQIFVARTFKKSVWYYENTENREAYYKVKTLSFVCPTQFLKNMLKYLNNNIYLQMNKYKYLKIN